MRRSLLAAPLIAAVAFGACDEASAPQGNAGDVTVLAFVDNDASGSMTAGDQPLQGLAITISRDGIVVDTENTDASGSVTFAGLPPGSYRVESSGTLPPGATLVSNSQPTAVINFRGDPVTVAFQYAMQPGTISGLLLREGDNAPAEGVLVVLRRAGSADTLARTTTSATGAYVFRLLGPGEYVVEFEQAGAINYGAAGRTREVTVTGGGASTVNVAYTGSVFITVAEARVTPVTVPPTRVAVIGDITVPAGRFTSSAGDVRSEIWVQDATGGIAAFFVNTSDSLVYTLGTRVEVIGPRTVNSGQAQIGSTTDLPVVRVRTGGTTRGPKLISADVAKTRADDGLLVRITGQTVEFVGAVTPASGAFNVRMRYGLAATDTFSVRVHSRFTGLTPANFVIGNTYELTGILTQFGGGAQLKPRFPSDVGLAVVTPQIVITEFMADPAFVSDAAGEYIELLNLGTQAVSLQNWTIVDAANNSSGLLGAITIQPGEYIVLGVNANQATNGGVPVSAPAYAAALSLNQGGDRIVLRDPSGATIDSVLYVTANVTPGRARGVIDPLFENMDANGANWQLQTSPISPVINPANTDRGTPGRPNDPPPVPPAPPTTNNAPTVALRPATVRQRRNSTVWIYE
jgi:hypothetical protein